MRPGVFQTGNKIVVSVSQFPFYELFTKPCPASFVENPWLMAKY